MTRSSTIDRTERSDRGGRDDGSVPPIDPRIDARRREVREARQGRLRRALLVVAIIATVIACGYGATRSALLDIDAVNVTGAQHTTPDAVRLTSGLRVGDHLMDLDLERAGEQIRTLPWVADVAVARSWTGTIDITITERSPAAAVHAGDGWLVVDSDRRVLFSSATAPADLPVIEGVPGVAVGQSLDASAQPAITVARALSPGLRTRVVAVHGDDPDALTMDIRPAGRIRFGSATDVQQKITSLQAVFAQADLAGLCVVDVRVPDSPVLTRGAPCA
jgi:cell division protein FtsQ